MFLFSFHYVIIQNNYKPVGSITNMTQVDTLRWPETLVFNYTNIKYTQSKTMNKATTDHQQWVIECKITNK